MESQAGKVFWFFSSDLKGGMFSGNDAGVLF